MNKLSSVLTVLPQLSQNELKQVAAVLKKLSKPSDDHRLYNALCATLSIKLPWARFAASQASKDYPLAEEVMLMYIGATFPEAESDLEQHAVMMFLLGSLGVYLSSMKVPVTLKTLLQFIPHHLVAAVDAQFPDYVKSGMAPLIYQHMVRK